MPCAVTSEPSIGAAFGWAEAAGVVERWNESLKHARLYRHDIADGIDLAADVNDYMIEYDEIRPHETLDWARPIDTYLPNPNRQTEPTETWARNLTRDRIAERKRNLS